MLLQNYLFMSLVRLQDCRCHQKENFRAFIEIDDSWGEGEGLAFQQGSKDAAQVNLLYCPQQQLTGL